MHLYRISLFILLFFGLTFSTNAQSLKLLDFEKRDLHYKTFTAILHNGKPIFQFDSPDGALTLSPSAKGKLSIATIDRNGDELTPVHNVGFKVGIKDWRSNTLWMYATETIFEVDLEDILKKCEQGDSLIFMTVDRTYRLPRHEIVITDGC